MLIEQTILEYLKAELKTDDVYLETPKDLPDTFVVLRLVDRGKENQINEVTVEFMSYAESKLAAATLDELVREAMENIVSLPNISCRFGGGNDNPDTVLKRHRYRCYFNLYY